MNMQSSRLVRNLPYRTLLACALLMAAATSSHASTVFRAPIVGLTTQGAPTNPGSPQEPEEPSGAGNLVASGALNFGQVDVFGAPVSPQNLQLSNTGDAPVTLGIVNSTNPLFSVLGGCPEIQPGASCNLSVSFQPTARGMQTGDLVFTTTQGQTVNVAVNGQAVAAEVVASVTSLTELRFKQGTPNDFSDEVTFTNTGDGPTQVTLSGPAGGAMASPWVVSPAQFTLAAGASRVVEVNVDGSQVAGQNLNTQLVANWGSGSHATSVNLAGTVMPVFVNSNFSASTSGTSISITNVSAQGATLQNVVPSADATYFLDGVALGQSFAGRSWPQGQTLRIQFAKAPDKTWEMSNAYIYLDNAQYVYVDVLFVVSQMGQLSVRNME